MRDLNSLTATQLLSIAQPEFLFSAAPDDAKREYRQLAMRWHPDHGSDPHVFAHIVGLYKSGVRKRRNLTWHEPADKVDQEVRGIKRFKLRDGSIQTFGYYTRRKFELGILYVSDHLAAFELDSEFEALARNGRRKIRQLSFSDGSMAGAMSPCLPQIVEAFDTTGSTVVIVRKTPDQLLLSDVLDSFGGVIEPAEHVGWILNVVLNIACYLQYADLTHNAISPGTVFVSPLRHSGMLLGGWWYAARQGDQMACLPTRTAELAPPDVIRLKTADARVDLDLIRALGRELLGDINCARLALNKSLPQPLVDWLCLPSSGNANEDYAELRNEILPACFGAPRFVPLNLERKDLYKE